MPRLVAILVVCLGLVIVAVRSCGAQGLVGHWKLQADCNDSSGKGNHGVGRNVTFAKAAVFNGRDSLVEVPDADSLRLGKGDFSVSVWVKPETPMGGVFGDLVSKFDPRQRRGFNFHIAGSSPGYNAMSDTRHVHFGIDDALVGPWEDCGRPCPTNSLITCLIVFEGELYCGIADARRAQDAARVFRWTGGKQWLDCGRLGDDPNHLSVQSMIVHSGKLYAGTGIFDWVRARGEVKGMPPAAKPHVFVYEGGRKWRDLGQVGQTARVLSMASFQGDLYVGLDRSPEPGKCFRQSGGQWVDCGAPDGANLENLQPLGGKLYATTHGGIYRFEGGQKWATLGDHPFAVTQIHSLDVYRGLLHVGTWPQGYVLRHEPEGQWTNTGRLGLPVGRPECNEVNDLVVHNGKLYAGVIPKAEVYRYESDGQWTLLGSMAHRPDWDRAKSNTWCRLTAMASYQGRLFASTGSCRGRSADVDPEGTLGRVYAIQIGQVASHERDIGGGWTHLAAVRRGAELRLYVNGRLSATSVAPNGRVLDLSNRQPLAIGFGPQTYFTGAMSDLRIYDCALEEGDVKQLCATR